MSRLLSLRDKSAGDFKVSELQQKDSAIDFLSNFSEAFEIIRRLNQQLNDERPWELLKSRIGLEFEEQLEKYFYHLWNVHLFLGPVLPIGVRKLEGLLKGEGRVDLFARNDVI